MPDETVHINDADVAWEASYEGPVGPTVMIERTFFSAGHTPTSGVSMGAFEVPPGAELPPHYHHPAEAYYVTEGEAEVYHDGDWRPLRRGDALFFPSDTVHGVRNRGTGRVAIVFVFPADSYDAIEYFYVPE